MTRSLKKSPFVTSSLLTRIQAANDKINVTITKSRSTTVIPIIVGKTIQVHSGNAFLPILIKERMVGRKLGEFVPTRD